MMYVDGECPFCGGEGKLDTKYIIYPYRTSFRTIWARIKKEPRVVLFYVSCKDCGAQGGYDKSPVMAIKKWKTRMTGNIK